MTTKPIKEKGNKRDTTIAITRGEIENKNDVRKVGKNEHAKNV